MLAPLLHKSFYRWIEKNETKIINKCRLREFEKEIVEDDENPYTSVLLISKEKAGRVNVYKDGQIYFETVDENEEDLLYRKTTFIHSKEDFKAIFYFFTEDFKKK